MLFEYKMAIEHNQQMEDSIQKPVMQDHSLASRFLVATTFGTVLATKVNTIGTIMDANGLLKEGNKTFGGKVKAVFNGELFDKLVDKFKTIMRTENKGVISAGAKVFKYTVITTVIGGVAGGALGWILGGRIENWRDIFKHPWDSTKIIFGFKEPNKKSIEPNSVDNIKYAATTPTDKTRENSTHWQDYTKERQQASLLLQKQ